MPIGVSVEELRGMEGEVGKPREGKMVEANSKVEGSEAKKDNEGR